MCLFDPLRLVKLNNAEFCITLILTVETYIFQKLTPNKGIMNLYIVPSSLSDCTRKNTMGVLGRTRDGSPSGTRDFSPLTWQGVPFWFEIVVHLLTYVFLV